MTPGVRDIIDIIETYAPLSAAESWDNSGLQIGDPGAQVNTVAFALDANKENVLHAADRGAGLLITHHPLIFPDIASIDVSTGVGRTIAAAMKANLSIYSAHTSLDHALYGTSRALASLIGLKDISPLPNPGPIEGLRTAARYAGVTSESTARDGILVLGRLEAPVHLIELAARLKTALGAPALRIVGETERPISLAAVCAGSGGDFIATAKTLGAEVLITGEVRYHAAVSADEIGLRLIEVGHFWSEMPVVRQTAETIIEEARQRGWDLVVLTIEGRDPFAYR